MNRVARSVLGLLYMVVAPPVWLASRLVRAPLLPPEGVTSQWTNRPTWPPDLSRPF